jgi:hypothetical protein
MVNPIDFPCFHFFNAALSFFVARYPPLGPCPGTEGTGDEVVIEGVPKLNPDAPGPLGVALLGVGGAPNAPGVGDAPN